MGFDAAGVVCEFVVVVGVVVITVEEGPEEKVAEVVAADLGGVGVLEPEVQVAIPVGDVGNAPLKEGLTLFAD